MSCLGQLLFKLLICFNIMYEFLYKPFVNYYTSGVFDTFLRHLDIIMAIHRLLLC